MLVHSYLPRESELRLNHVEATCAVNLKISMCTFSNNNHYYDGENHLPIYSICGIVVEFNDMTAIWAETSSITFSGSLRIYSNTGLSQWCWTDTV